MARIVDFLGSVLELGFGKNNFGEEKLGMSFWNKEVNLCTEKEVMKNGC